jgi:methionine sulfoxide reductase catalytic subunit
MLIKPASDIKSSNITSEQLYHSRRDFIRAASVATIAFAAGTVMPDDLLADSQDLWPKGKKGPFDTDEDVNTYKDITTYNNFYEFGTDKSDPAEYAKDFKISPWNVAVEGEAKHTGNFNLEDLLKNRTMEDRIYRHRCVEGWSMVIPWHGFPMSDLIKKFEPTSKAKYVEFTTLLDPNQMPGQRRSYLNWPYREGLRLDEAMNPLAFVAIGLYGKTLPNQNGAPLRTVIPWKYGFKCCKSVVRIRFTESQPVTAWNEAAPNEYGFYSNVNPEVDHPRWSQKNERRIGEFFKRKTLMFNGYGDHVASLYSGMDLRKYF